MQAEAVLKERSVIGEEGRGSGRHLAEEGETVGGPVTRGQMEARHGEI
jgi:hypothetical protein